MRAGLTAVAQRAFLPSGWPRPRGARFTFFLAVNDNRVLREIQAMDPGELLQTANDRVCLQARKFVYSTDASHLEFVEARLGRKLPSTPLETRAG